MGFGLLEIGLLYGEVSGSDPNRGASLDGDDAGLA